MSKRGQAQAALDKLAGKTIVAAVIAGDNGREGQYERLLIETTDGSLITLETRDGHDGESWLEVA